jgi:hypothetical protein
VNTETFHPTARTALVAHVPRPRAAAEAASSHRLADYVVDVFFIVLLAAPFVIFQATPSVQEAVVATQPAADATYGPE